MGLNCEETLGFHLWYALYQLSHRGSTKCRELIDCLRIHYVHQVFWEQILTDAHSVFISESSQPVIIEPPPHGPSHPHRCSHLFLLILALLGLKLGRKYAGSAR